MKRLSGKLIVALVMLAATTGSVPAVSSQTELDVSACEFKTRWKDAFQKCTGCCDAREYSCPCTT